MGPLVLAAEPTPTPAPTTSVPANTVAASARPKFGEAITLQQDGKPFGAIYTEQTTGKPKGALLIVPDLNRAADAPGVVTALATSVPRSGWSSLTLELPSVPADGSRSAYGKDIEAATKRVAAGLEFLRSKQAAAIVVLGHGLGATVNAVLLAQGSAKRVVGLVAVGWDLGDDLLPPLNALTTLEKLKLPVLDIFGGRDFESVRAQAERRGVAVRKGQPDGYLRVEVRDANHEFKGLELFLVNRVRGWMERVRAQSASASSTPSPAEPKP
jgi:hypothetical protein